MGKEPDAFDEAEFTQRRIVDLCEAALVRAGAAGVFPTPLNEVIEVAGIDEILDISELPTDITKPSALRRILGALHFRHRTVFVDRAQSGGRVRWTEAHEAVHGILPWHEGQALLDDDETLFRSSEDQREVEANFGAAHLVFQGKRFFEQALDFEHSIKTPIMIHDEFGASIHATARYYAERHPESMALALCGRFPRQSGHVPIFTMFESPSFKRQFGVLRQFLPEAGMPVNGGLGIDGLAAIARSALSMTVDVAHCELKVRDLGGDFRRFRVEAFNNQHVLFVLFTRRSAMPRLGKKIDVMSS